MLEVKYNNNIAVVDVRERILQGEHPRKEIVDFVREAKRGTIIEVLLPHRAEPLVLALKSIGVSATIAQVAPDHFRLICVKV